MNPAHAEQIKFDVCSRWLWMASLAFLSLCFFTLYWTSSFSLEARGATTYFGADSWHFSPLAAGEIHDRIFRLHPLTVALSLGWMKLFSPLTAWIAPLAILKAMFACIGALGVCAAAIAFAAFMPRMQALIWGGIYASSTTIWYFSSFEESKIVSATLVAIYIALYIYFRTEWAPRRIATLSAVLFVACLNEITAAFLVAIPAIEQFLKHKFALRRWRWVFVHALAAPFALLALELLRRQIPIAEAADGSNFLEIFLYYVSRNSYTLQTLWDFLQRWFLFNIAAPEPELNFAVAKQKYGGDFEPTVLKYLDSFVSVALVGVFAILLLANFWFRSRNPLDRLIFGLAAYALVRLLFFFVFLPGECLLYSPSVTLAHLLLLALPFAATRFPYKTATLFVFAMLLLANNAIFIFTAQTVPLAGQ